MRVVVVTRDDQNQVFGGDTVMVRKIQKHLRPHGIEFEITTAQMLPTSCNVDVVHVTFLYLVESVQRALGWAQRYQLPVVISPLFEDPLLLWFQWALRRPGKWRVLSNMLGQHVTRKLYVTWHTARAKYSAHWHLQRDLLQSMHVVPNSRYELDHLARWFQLPDLDATVVPLGVDPDVFGQPPTGHPIAELGKLTGYVLEVGRIEERKNQLGLLEALHNVTVPIVFLGEADRCGYEAAYVELCHKLAAARGNVHFLERVPEGLLPSLYARAAVHVLPSWSERPGLVTLEAAACGCKVVSTSFSPIYEYLGGDAWYCQPDDVRSIRTAVMQALTAPTPPDLRTRVLSNFTWEKTALKMLNVYQQLAS